jgi:hypothetical protein
MIELNSIMYCMKYTIEVDYNSSNEIKAPISLTNRFTIIAPNYDTAITTNFCKTQQQYDTSDCHNGT